MGQIYDFFGRGLPNRRLIDPRPSKRDNDDEPPPTPAVPALAPPIIINLKAAA